MFERRKMCEVKIGCISGGGRLKGKKDIDIEQDFSVKGSMSKLLKFENIFEDNNEFLCSCFLASAVINTCLILGKEF